MPSGENAESLVPYAAKDSSVIPGVPRGWLPAVAESEGNQKASSAHYEAEIRLRPASTFAWRGCRPRVASTLRTRAGHPFRNGGS